MQLVAFSVTNYRSITRAYKLPLRRSTALIGPNNEGKSNNIVRDDGLSYGDYVEQLTFLLFLKMAGEQSRASFNKPSPIPKGFGRDKLVKFDGDNLEIHYRHTLEELGRRTGILRTTFSEKLTSRVLLNTFSP